MLKSPEKIYRDRGICVFLKNNGYQAARATFSCHRTANNGNRRQQMLTLIHMARAASRASIASVAMVMLDMFIFQHLTTGQNGFT